MYFVRGFLSMSPVSRWTSADPPAIPTDRLGQPCRRLGRWRRWRQQWRQRRQYHSHRGRSDRLGRLGWQPRPCLDYARHRRRPIEPHFGCGGFVFVFGRCCWWGGSDDHDYCYCYRCRCDVECCWSGRLDFLGNFCFGDHQRSGRRGKVRRRRQEVWRQEGRSGRRQEAERCRPQSRGVSLFPSSATPPGAELTAGRLVRNAAPPLRLLLPCLRC